MPGHRHSLLETVYYALVAENSTSASSHEQYHCTMMSAVPDTSYYCFKSQFADCFLHIEEEFEDQQPIAGQTARKGKRKRTIVLTVPTHSILLATSSTYFKAKLENWSNASTTSSRMPEVLLPVPAGQLQVGQLLIKTIYQKQPQLLDVSQEQLLQLITLADRYSVEKVLPAAASALKAIPMNQLAWDTALALLQLPESCAVQESFQDIASVAGDKVVSELGDLDLIWEHPEEVQQLLMLPAAALKQLLLHNGTSVACENTVAYTVLRWFEAQQGLTAEAAAQMGLLQLVRMRHCSQLYISSVVAQHKLFSACFSPPEAALAVACCTGRGYKALLLSRSSLLKKYPAWCSKKRPDTFSLQLFCWKVQLSDLEAAVKEVLDSPQRATSRVLAGDAHIFQGQRLHLGIGCINAVMHGVELSVVLCAHDLEGTAMCQMTIDIECEAAEQHEGNGPAAKCTILGRLFCEADNTFIAPDADFLRLGVIRQWEAAESHLRVRGFVHADGCLHLRAKILDML